MPSDAQLTPPQRAAAIERIGESIALRSGAGCGKTFVLARRFVELLRRHPDPPNALSRLVALTFTEKAALEMSSRVREMLLAAAAEAPPEQRGVIRAWLDELPEARIATIHGFCASLLRGRAVEAGIDPSFTVCADELLAAQMVAEACEQAVLAAVEAGESDTAALLADLSFDALLELVRELVSRRTDCDLAGLLDPSATRDRWRALLDAGRAEWLAPLAQDAALRAEIDALAACPCTDPSDKLHAFRTEQLGIVEQIAADPAAATAEVFARLKPSPGGIGSAKAWGKDEVREVRAALKSVIGKVTEYAVFAEDLDEADELASRQLAALARLALDAERVYAQTKRRRGLLDFDDLLARTERLLASSEAARAALAGQIDQLLIDECQDTNEFQVRLLGRLIDLLPGGEGAPGPGKLFVVGDAKQSIYRFRGAQVDVFERLCGRLGRANQEYLSTSFRTHAAGIAFVNHLFRPMMGADYDPIEAHRQDVPPHPSVEILLAGGEDGEPIPDAATAARAQAAATAERIAAMLANGERLVWDSEAARWRAVQPRDIAVLFARMTKSLDYERELQRRAVPYYVVAGTGFFQQQEVFDVLNALQAIDNPLDDVALFGTLRGSLFGLNDNALMHVAEAHVPPYFPALRKAGPPAGLAADQREALVRAVALIARLHARKDAVGIDRLLEDLLAETGYEAVLLSQARGARMLGNVRIAIHRARAAASDGLSLAQFASQMREMVINEGRYEQAAVAGEHENVVRLMTLHKAKGLEFPVVLLPDLNAGRRGPTGRCLIRNDWGVVLRPAGPGEDGEAAEPLSLRLARRLEAEADRRESIRKLYVGATRHKDHLVFVGADWRGRDGRYRDGDGYLAQIDASLGISEALDGDGCEIAYGSGQYAATVRRVVPAKPGSRPRDVPRGQKLLRSARSGGQLGGAILRAVAGPGDLPLVGPLPTEVGRVELAVTALNDFAKCPMLYRWRYELRVPGEPIEAAGSRGGDAPRLDAATVGTLYHLCMEHLDFASPQPAAALLTEAAVEMELADEVDLPALAAALDDALRRFRDHELCSRLAGARQVFRELDFVLACPPAVMRGQIDLLFQDDAGGWHVVDYKSDRVEGAELAARAEEYALQLLLYAAAARRHVGERPGDATLYFLRPGETWSFEVSEASLEAVESRTAGLAAELIAARRAGRFQPRGSETCDPCPYAPLCRGAGHP